MEDLRHLGSEGRRLQEPSLADTAILPYKDMTLLYFRQHIIGGFPFIGHLKYSNVGRFCRNLLLIPGQRSR